MVERFLSANETMKDMYGIGLKMCAVLLSAVVAAGCSRGGEEHALQALGLQGRVRSVVASAYRTAECDGGTEQGSRTEDAGANAAYRFDEAGNLVSAEYLPGGVLSGWEDYVYAADGRLERIVSRSVGYGGDRTVICEWGDGGRCVRYTYDEQGRQRGEEHLRRRSGRFRSVAVSYGDTTVVTIRYRKGRPVREERRGPAGTTVKEYAYDRAGNPVRTVSFVGGQKEEIAEMEYASFDGEGNWIGRTIRRTDAQGACISCVREERVIAYY